MRQVGLAALAVIGMVLVLNYPRPKDRASASLSPVRDHQGPTSIENPPLDGDALLDENSGDGLAVDVPSPNNLLSDPFFSEPKFDFHEEEEQYNRYLSADGREQRFVGETTLKSGQNFFTVLRSIGVEASTILSMAQVCRDTYNIDRLPSDIAIRVYKEKDLETLVDGWLVKIELSPLETLQIREHSGGFAVELIEAERNIVHKMFEGQVVETLWVSVRNSGLPVAVVNELNQILAAYLAGGKAQKGDQWQVVIEEFWVQNKFISYGSIVAASYKSKGMKNPVSLYRFEHEDAAPGFYHADGSSLDLVFSSTPVQGARVTSGFSTRFHPVLKIMRPHLGIDFAAPIGTGVRTVGDGKIVEMNIHPSFGKMIKIRHGSGFETLYAHLSGFARGLKVGAGVSKGDVIGYVGMTGRTTGPHLHFAMLQNKRFVNPRKITVPRKENLTGPSLALFTDHVNHLKSSIPKFETL